MSAGDIIHHFTVITIFTGVSFTSTCVDTVQTGRRIAKFRRNLLPPSLSYTSLKIEAANSSKKENNHKFIAGYKVSEPKTPHYESTAMKTSDHTKRLGCFIFNFVQKSWIQTCDQFCKDVQIVYHGCHQYIAIPSTHVAAITGRVLILPTISFAVDIAKFQFLWHSINILVTSVPKNR